MPFPRLHLFELEDLPWYPRIIRDYATDYLQFIEHCLHLHRPVLPLLRQFLAETHTTDIVDLCAGGGGPVLALVEALQAEGIPVHVTLTDKFPNHEAFARLASLCPQAIAYENAAVDATGVPSHLRGLRTMFNAFHHFAPAQAQAVLQNAVETHQPIAIFEIPERRLFTFVALLLTPLIVLAVTPFMRPFRWSRLLFTYLLPLVPLTSTWDGLVSVCRAYRVPELYALTRSMNSYEWTTYVIPIRGNAGHLTCLFGRPSPQKTRTA